MGVEIEDMEGIRALSDLLEENSESAKIGYTSLKPKSTRMPPPMESPELDLFLKLVCNESETMNKRVTPSAVGE